MTNASESTKSTRTPAPEQSRETPLRRWGRRAVGLLGGLLLTVVVLVGLFLLALQSEAVGTAVAQYLARTYNPVPETELTVERASGSWIQSIELTNVSLTRTDSASGTELTMAHVDTLSASYSLGALLRGRIRLHSALLRSPSVTMRQAADSTWDWGRLLTPSEEAPPDTAAGLPLRIDRIRLSDGHFAAAFYTDGRDSTAHVRGLELRAGDVHIMPTIEARIDTLGAVGHVPADPATVRVAARGGLRPDRLQLDTLDVASARSHVRGHGTVRLPTDTDDARDETALTVRADPLVLGDLIPFLPTLAVQPSEAVRFDARVTGSGRLLTLDASAQFSGGGGFTVEGAATPTTTGGTAERPLRYRLHADVDELTTSLLGPLDPSQNVVTASVDGSLSGPALAALDGTLDVRVEETRIDPIHLSQLTLHSTFDAGVANVDLDGRLNGTEIAIQGVSRPFATEPSFDLTANVNALSLETVAPDAGLDGTITADVRVEGMAMGTDRATYDLRTTLAPSQIAAQPIDGGKLSISLAPDEIRVDGALTFPSGRMSVTGHTLRDNSSRFTLERARLENVNLTALAGDTTDSRITGTIEAEGRGFSPSTMKATGRIAVQQGHYAQYQLREMTTTARLESGRLTTESSAVLNGGRWSLATTSRPFAPVFSAELTRGRFQHVDIGPLLQDTTQSSALHGTIRGRVEGSSADQLRLDANIQVDTSRVNRQKISTASVDVHLREGDLDSDVVMESPEGSAEFALRARPFDDRPQYRISTGSFDRLNVGAIAGIPGLTTQLSGSVTLRALGTELSTLALDSELSLTESTINRATLSQGHLTASAENGDFTTQGEFSVAGGSVTLTGQLDALGSTPTYTIRSRLDSLDLGALAGFDSTRARLGQARWSARGRGMALDSLSASSKLVATGIQVDRLEVDTVNVAATAEQGLLTVDTLTVASNVLEGRAQGPVALTRGAGASNLDLHVQITDLSPLRPLLDARLLTAREGRVEAHIYGGVNDQRFDGKVQLDGFIYDEFRLGDTELAFNGRRGTDQPFDRLALEGKAGYVAISGVSATHARVDGTYDGTTVDVSTNVTLDKQHTFDVAASFQPEAEPIEISLDRLNMRLGPDRWRLEQPTTLTVGDYYRIDQFRLQSGSQQIQADGVVAPEGTQSLVVTTEDVRLGSFAPLMGLSGLDGEVTGRFAMTGPASDPQIDGRLDMSIRSEGEKVGSLQLEAKYDDLTAVLDARLTHTDGSVLTADGSLPVDLRLSGDRPANTSDQPIRVNASTEQFPVNWVDPFLDPETIRSVSGTVVGDVAIRGTFDDPELSGTMAVSEIGAYLTPLETAYRDGSANLKLQADQITLERAIVRSSNGGALEASGVVDFPELTVGEFNLSVEASDLLAIDTRAYRGIVIDGALRLQGTTRRPEVSGTVDVDRGNVYYSEALAETEGSATTVPLTTQDELVLEERFGLRVTASDTTTYDFYEASTLDLTVGIERDMWLRSTGNPEMNVQFSGDLDVRKAPNEDPQIFGTIDVIEGQSTIRQFGQEFEITEGTLTFSGNPYLPYLDLTAVYEQRARGTGGSEVQITLRLSGRPNNLTPSLSSDPAMSTRNILSYLATGRPADELFSGGGEGGNLATRVALGQATNFVENLAASELGLDIVRLDIRPEGVSYLTVGRYFSSRFFASIEQPVITSSVQSSVQSNMFVPDVTLEYELTDHLLLRSLSGQQSLQLYLLFQYAY